MGKKLLFFSRYFEDSIRSRFVCSKPDMGTESLLPPPIPMIGMVVKFLKEQRKDRLMLLPATNAPWVNQVSAHIVDLMELSKPFQATQFTVLNPSGKRMPKKYPHAMIAVKLCVEIVPNNLTYLNK